MRKLVACLAGVLALAAVPSATANTSHAGWPAITGMLLINKLDQARPLDGRPGSDPFDGADYSEPCPLGEIHSHCIPGGIPVAGRAAVTCSTLAVAETQLTTLLGLSTRPSVCSSDLTSAALVPIDIGHNELLGGHGNDTIHAGPAGDVIWGDYKPSDQPSNQVDYLFGGPGNDFIYASHGVNHIRTGVGEDVVHAHFGSGTIDCGSIHAIVYISHASRAKYRLTGCTHISYRTLGY
jgi:Ca2+-binding RTX toxin-like protein